ncbi:MAG: type II toxin-antitoxin system prevent-host-death family antitoxin [Candidatus Roizmanbacteria bacterium]|nr:type II toxin-antitoxin system prevent-host-death family antitoxin [Candidatus Roizmanbacteria bacterium]MCR4313133.1 type II toxin-antitoxin system prevent-host-death family antitoxin [Candidatus Roizmanbacteria bacterium]
MLIANIHNAKSNLSSLIASVLAGKDVIIAKAGKPIIKLIRYIPEKKQRISGLFKGQTWISDDFTDEDPEIEKMFSLK